MPSFFIRWVPRIVYMLGWWNCRLLNKHICLPGTAWMGQEPVLSWDCGGERLPPASLSMRPADLFIVGSDGFHKPNGTDTPLMIQACRKPRSAVSRHCTTTQNHTAHSTNMPEFCFLSSPLLVLYKKKKKLHSEWYFVFIIYFSSWVQLFHIQKSSTDFQETACLAVCLLPPHFLFETIAAVQHPSVWNERTKTVQYGQLTLEDDVSNLTVARQGSKRWYFLKYAGFTDGWWRYYKMQKKCEYKFIFC